MTGTAETLAELLFYATQFSVRARNLLDDRPRTRERDEARLKLSRCERILELLQAAFNEDRLDIDNPAVCAQFRVLIIHLLWVSYYIRDVIDFRLYRILMQLEAGFTNLLIVHT